MKNEPSPIQCLRREQIVEAAVAVIAEQGLQNLSLSGIEHRAGMSRGQLTYYFDTKEKILLAVFDRTIGLLCQQAGESGPQPPPPESADWMQRVEFVLEMILRQPPFCPEFNALQFTFLAQVGHRADFRERLASLYEDWRRRMAHDLEPDAARRPGGPVSPRAFASVVQALLHGLTVQLAADPDAFDRAEVLELCLDLLGSYLNRTPRKNRPPAAKTTGKGRRRQESPRVATRRLGRPRGGDL